MILKTHYYNVKQKNEKPRIFIESKDPIISGFSIGKRYDIEYENGKIILSLSENGTRKVAIRIASKTRKIAIPVLDLNHKEMNSFPIGSKAKVEYSENTITITNERN